MAPRIDTDVLIVGGGPVGLTLGMDLAQRGVGVTLAEMRAAGEPPSVRSNVVSARTMEAFRRLGVVRAVRNAGLPADYPNDVAIRTTATGFELARVLIPCRAQRYTEKDGPDGWWPTPEPPHRINQMFLEPALFAAASVAPRLRILNRTRVIDFEQREDGVLAVAKNLDAAPEQEIFARYLVGCDGAHSEIRRGIGAALTGDAAVVQAQSTYIRAPLGPSTASIHEIEVSFSRSMDGSGGSSISSCRSALPCPIVSRASARSSACRRRWRLKRWARRTGLGGA
jgi:2-polyprenyl-6-methoxyphenol hydroxylase-like FAD-dependent oxidoreductase